jgi:hypothetical protein
MMADDKFEEDEVKPRARGEAGVEQLEGGGRHRLVETADPAHERVGGEEGQVIEANDSGVTISSVENKGRAW